MKYKLVVLKLSKSLFLRENSKLFFFIYTNKLYKRLSIDCNRKNCTSTS